MQLNVKSNAGQNWQPLYEYKTNMMQIHSFWYVWWSYPELLDQIHVGPLILLHAALRYTRHVSSQSAINQHTQHVQHSCEEFTVGEKQTWEPGGSSDW